MPHATLTHLVSTNSLDDVSAVFCGERNLHIRGSKASFRSDVPSCPYLICCCIYICVCMRVCTTDRREPTYSPKPHRKTHPSNVTHAECCTPVAQLAIKWGSKYFTPIGMFTLLRFPCPNVPSFPSPCCVVHIYVRLGKETLCKRDMPTYPTKKTSVSRHC